MKIITAFELSLLWSPCFSLINGGFKTSTSSLSSPSFHIENSDNNSKSYYLSQPYPPSQNSQLYTTSYIDSLGAGHPARAWETQLYMRRGSGIYGNSNSKSNNMFKKFFTLSSTNAILWSNILVYVACQIFPSITDVLMKNDRLISRGQTYRLLTCCFAHGSLYHIGCNLYSLYNMGPQAERLFGSSRFLSIYLMSGLIANMGTFLAHTSPYSLGASGCVFGIIGAFGMFYYRNKKVLGQSSDIALQSIVRTIGINLFYGASMRGVDQWGHFGGLLGE